MLSPAEIINASLEDGPVAAIAVVIPGWTESDERSIGTTYVIGNHQTGFVGVVQNVDLDDQYIWIGETRDQFVEARDDLVAKVGGLRT